MAKSIKNPFISNALRILPALFSLCLFANQHAQAQYPRGYTPTQQQQPGTAAPQTAYPQSYQQPAQPTYQQPAQPVQPTYRTATTLKADLDSERPPFGKKGNSDHERAVGEFGLALLGIMNMPILEPQLDETLGIAVPRLDEEADLLAPTVGLRYWINKTFGLEAGLGLGFSEGSIEQLTPEAEAVNRDLSDTIAITYHVGVPIALLYSTHFVFELVPIVNGGFSSGTVYGVPTVPGDPTTVVDWDISTFLLQIGSRVGAEIHFGFLGIEQLAVQASLGFQFSYLTATAETAGYTENSSKLSLRTTAGSKPWDLFTKSLSAIYYIY